MSNNKNDPQPPTSSSSSSSSTAAAVPTQRDVDCAFLARDALFPLKIQRDGSHPTQFPASEALAKIREDAIEHHPERASSSFFPRRVVVVHDINHPNELQWNGQPDIDAKKASVEVIPNLLSVSCRICNDGRQAYVRQLQNSSSHSSSSLSSVPMREIVLCSDKLLKSDYKPATFSSTPMHDDKTPRSMVAVETALAHFVTKVGQEVALERKNDNGNNNKKKKNNDEKATITCQDLAAMEIKAAKAAECYYSKMGSEIKRAPQLGHTGFSWYPAFVQEMLRNRCMRAVATQSTAQEYGRRDGKKCVNQVFNDAK